MCGGFVPYAVFCNTRVIQSNSCNGFVLLVLIVLRNHIRSLGWKSLTLDIIHILSENHVLNCILL